MEQNNLGTHYDTIYQETGAGFRGGEAMQVVERIPSLLKEGTVLDIGGGVGRNALFLARNGFTVEVVDLSAVGLSKIEESAKQDGLPIITTLGDMTKIGLHKEYDVIIATYVLHHMENAIARQLIADIQNHTKPGGINVVSTFTKEGDFYKSKPNNPNFYPNNSELKKLYKNWEILSYTEKESTALAKHQNGTPMINTAAILLAQKPG